MWGEVLVAAEKMQFMLAEVETGSSRVEGWRRRRGRRGWRRRQRLAAVELVGISMQRNTN
jgi:hypothetical protein